MKTVLLRDGTVGDTDYNAKDGDTVRVDLHDENGNQIQITGEVEEVLEEEEFSYE